MTNGRERYEWIPDLTGAKTLIVPSLSIVTSFQNKRTVHLTVTWLTFLHRLSQIARLALSEAIGCSRPYHLPLASPTYACLEKAGRLIPRYHEDPILLAVTLLPPFSPFHALPSSDAALRSFCMTALLVHHPYG